VTYNAPGAGIQTGGGADWFGPLNPMPPTAPPEVAGRLFDYPSGYNLNIQPRAYEAVTFGTMRALADGYDLMRLVIETRKDQVAALKWNIQPRDHRVAIKGEVADRVKKLEAFFMRPDKVNFWDTWLRMILEDLLVLDAPAIHLRRTRGGDLFALEQIDGATVKRVIDDWGRTPEYPIPAYQQVLKGYPAVDYTTKDLLYRPRNSRVNKVYGYSPVEQILMTVNIALRRQVFQLNYFTEGNIPEALIGVPETWTPDQIRQFQDWFDSVLTGNLAERRRARFVPNAVGKTYIPTKDSELFGAAEEWMARVVCYAFSVSPQPFVKMMNRATAASAQEVAVSEGLAPLQNWVKALIDTIILDEFNEPDLEFWWSDGEELDPTARMKILTGYATKGVLAINEARIKMGEDPFENPIFNEPLVQTAMGYVKADPTDAANPLNQPDAHSLNGDAPAVDDKGAVVPPKDATKPAPKVVDTKTGKFAKGQTVSPIMLNRPKVRRAETSLGKAMASVLGKLGDDIASQVEKKLAKLGKADEAEVDVDALIASLDFSLLDKAKAALEEDLGDVAVDSGKLALAQIGPKYASELVNQVNARAVKWADAHAAEMLSVKGDESIIVTTREMVRASISAGLSDNVGASAMADILQDLYAFSPERAAVIATTEIGSANSQGALQGYKEAAAAGVGVKKEWLVMEGEACDECQGNADDGAIELDDVFSSGDDAPLAHPGCVCVVSPVVDGDTVEDEIEED
jgi:portal protein